MQAPVIEAKSPMTKNNKYRSNEEATKGSHRSAQVFYFLNRLVAKARKGAQKTLKHIHNSGLLKKCVSIRNMLKKHFLNR